MVIPSQEGVTMNQKKLEQYELTGSIHTLSVKSTGMPVDIQKEVQDCIESASRSTKKDVITTTTKINPNKLMGDIFSYSEFIPAYETILAGAGILDPEMMRADFRLDNYDPAHYLKYAKLNKYLISALAVTYKVQNVYRTVNLFTQKQLSIAIKNRDFESENYDKRAESNGTDIAQSRLELRSKRMSNNDIQKEFTEKWFARWDKAIKNLKAVQARYNEELVKLYFEGKNAYPVRFRSMTDFLIQYQDCIFCTAQMIDLLERLGVDNPEGKAKYHKRKYGIEYFSQADVKRAVKEIKRATTEFFES